MPSPRDLILTLLALPLQQATAPAPFAEVQARALPGVTTTCGTPRKDYILEVNGGGLALADFDGDGDVDLVVVDGSTIERAQKGEPGLPPRLFLNDGQGRFTPAGASWAMTGGRWGMGAAVGDVDSDGWPDLLVTQWGPNRLFRNREGKGFEEITDKAGLGTPSWSTSACFLDFDGDGVLDLAVANYLDFEIGSVPPPGGACSWKGYPVMCGPEGLKPQHDRLYRGLGGGRFEDVTQKSGFVPKEAGFGLGAMPLDYDLDGDTDLYVANDSTPNFLWENQGGGKFAEVGFARGVSHDAAGKEQASMGIGCGDADLDGREDLLVTNFSAEPNALYMSRGPKAFRESSFPAGIGGPSLAPLGWGTALADFDLDGDLDAFVLNGHVYPQADNPGTDTSYAQADEYYENLGKGRFAVRALSSAPPRVSRAAAVADLDGDGDLDIVGLELGSAVRVLENQSRTPGKQTGPHWLAVELRGKGPNRAALGASVHAQWAGGERRTEIRTSAGYQAATPAEARFGLGAAEKVERLTIRWPSGKQQVLADLPVDRRIVVEEAGE